MTDTEANELNAATARAMNWEDLGDGHWAGPEYGARLFRPLPDFCRDVMALGYLVGWCDANSCWQVRRGEDVAGNFGAAYRAVLRQFNSPHQVFGDFSQYPGEALCRAIVAYAEAEHPEMPVHAPETPA